MNHADRGADVSEAGRWTVRFDEDLTPEQWRVEEDRDAVEAAERDEALHRFLEDAQEFLDNAADADDHSSDVDPGRGGW